MKFNLTWTITAILAVSSFLSPIFVAIINNRHQEKIRKMDLQHDEKMRQMDLKQQATIRQSDIYYSNKKDAFSNFVEIAGGYLSHTQNPTQYGLIVSSLKRVLIFCNPENQDKLCRFREYIDNDIFGSNYSQREKYNQLLNDLSLSLNKELELTKPVIDSKQSECQ